MNFIPSRRPTSVLDITKRLIIAGLWLIGGLTVGLTAAVLIKLLLLVVRAW